MTGKAPGRRATAPEGQSDRAPPCHPSMARPTEADRQAYRRLYRDLLEAQREELVRLRDRGAISDGILRKLQHGFDLQESALRFHLD